MQTTTIEPLRWQDQPARIIITWNSGRPKVCFQTTSPTDFTEMCKGRPAEELPRILSIFSPSHHLVSAMALDSLFKVKPPPPALNMRESLLQAQYYSHHLRKIYFLLSSGEDPFSDHRTSEKQGRSALFSHQLMNQVMHHAALAQEAATILGGRHEHPITVVAGGVSRFLKEGHYSRLSEIAESCLKFAKYLEELFRKEFFGEKKADCGFEDLDISPMPFLFISGQNVVIKDKTGKESDCFPLDQTFEKIGLSKEDWTYAPFAHVKEKGWNLEADSEFGIPDSAFFVGPLARLNSGKAAETQPAEEEKGQIAGNYGPFPNFSVGTAYGALLAELVWAGEKMKHLYDTEKLTGPAIRVIPSEMGQEGCAGLESPNGFIFHRYKVDERGIAKEIEILDTASENNALRCHIAEKAVEDSMARKHTLEEIKNRIEISLLPF